MLEQVRLLKWFALRPRYYRILGLFVRRKLNPTDRSLDDTAEPSMARCREVAVEATMALNEIRHSHSATHAPVRSLFAADFALADAAARECPVIMGGPGDLDLLFGCAEHLQATRAIETGVAYGWSSLALLLSMSQRPGARLISTDLPYPERDNARFVGCVVSQRLRSAWLLLRGPDRQVLPTALSTLSTIDLCHYDSDKSYHGRMWAYPRLWDALRPGGIFISDDIGDNMAFWDFAGVVGLKPIVVLCSGKYVGVLTKPTAR